MGTCTVCNVSLYVREGMARRHELQMAMGARRVEGLHVSVWVRVGLKFVLYAFPLVCLAHGSTSLLRPFPAAVRPACLSAASNAPKTRIRVQARTQARTRTRTRPRTDGKVQEIVHDAIVWPRQACTPSDAAPRCRMHVHTSALQVQRKVVVCGDGACGTSGCFWYMIHGRSVCAD